MFPDTYHKTRAEAFAEVQRRRDGTGAAQLITRIEKSPYGGYRVRSIPAEFILDHIADSNVLASNSLTGGTKLFA